MSAAAKPHVWRLLPKGARLNALTGRSRARRCASAWRRWRCRRCRSRRWSRRWPLRRRRRVPEPMCTDLRDHVGLLAQLRAAESASAAYGQSSLACSHGA